MKRFVSFALALFVLVSIFAQAAFAEDIYGLAIMKISTSPVPTMM